MRYYTPEYPEVVRETEKYVDFIPNRASYGDTKTREHKFLCVGGPFDGCYYTRTQLKFATMPGCYREFNNAGGSRHKVVFAWNTEER